MKLFRRLILRPLRRDLMRTLLTLVSIALGVAVVIAIDLAGDASAGSFESSLTTLVGRVDYEITANAGVDEHWLEQLAALPVDARFSAVIEQPVVIEGHGSTTLYGIDIVAGGAGGGGEFKPENLGTSAVVSNELAERLGWTKGDAITLRGPANANTFRIETVAEKQNTAWIGIDIGAAQELLDSFGKVQRIEVFVGPGEDGSRVEKLIRATVPSGWEVETPGARSEENRRMLRAFRWNLRILSYISLLVGAFLIYNTIAVSVVRRRTEIGILRALGTSARGVLVIFLGEAAMLGILGSVLGILLGRGLASGIVGMISDTVNALFTTSAPGTLALAPMGILSALITGTSVAVFSALLPALEASRIAPADAMRRSAVEHEARLNTGRSMVFAGLAAAGAVGLCQLGPMAGRPVAGYVATLLAVAAAALLAPSLISGVIGRLRGFLKGALGPEGLVAGRSLVASLSRTSIVVTALATAVAMMVAVGVMVGSFRETVQVWLNGQLSADIYMRAPGQTRAGVFAPLAGAVQQIVEKTPGVDSVDVLRAVEIRYDGLRATLAGARTEILSRTDTFRFLSGNGRQIMASLPGRDRAIVTEPFADKHHVKPGDVLRIPIGAQVISLTVAGIYYDYSNDRGMILADESTLLKYLPGQPVNDIAVYVKRGFDHAAVRRDLENRLSAYPVMMAPNEFLRAEAVKVFDRTFAVTYALEGVAILVAMLGAANSLLALVLDRRREIGLIRYLGASRGQVRRMILTEAGLLGFLAAGMGLVLGMALSLVLIYVINKQSFGWTIQFHPPLALLSGELLLVWGFTILAGVYPARFAARLEPAESVHDE